ncbi:MAG: DUF992 domain-containing protein, partial [Rhizobiaceae bacterium]|nr:DUF992 domain-containing protein [Rhizobiaceae bacterium]
MKPLVILTAAICIGAAFPAAAQQPGIELGVLDCVVDGGTGFIIGSTKDVSCTYRPADPKNAPESYFGVIRKFGLDIGT